VREHKIANIVAVAFVSLTVLAMLVAGLMYLAGHATIIRQ
jgi:hypothetical protein